MTVDQGECIPLTFRKYRAIIAGGIAGLIQPHKPRPIEFEMEVIAEDVEGKKFREKTVLKDISGGGARFMSKQVDNYFPGQPLELTIDLPRTDSMTAHMKGNATVVRIIKSNDSDTNHKNQGVSVAVMLNTLLQFGTSDMKS